MNAPLSATEKRSLLKTRRETFPQQILSVIAIFATTACILLFVLRTSSAISFVEPLQLTTSGSEEESLFGVWKVTQEDTLYVDRLKIPYAAIVYNWLFYYSYGYVAGFTNSILELGDPWLPTIGRLFTFLGACVATVGTFVILQREFGPAGGIGLVLAGSFAIYNALGPLVGFWSITVRPDVWALALEIIASLVFLAWYPRQRWLAIIGLAIAGYLAWSFKQTSIISLCAGCSVLLLRRDWHPLFLLATIMVGAFSLTFLIGGTQYTKNVLFLDWPLVYDLHHAFVTAGNAAIKSAPAFLGGIATGVWLLTTTARRANARKHNTALFAVCGTIAAILLHLPSSAQIGASENYYFSLHWFLILLSSSGIGLALIEGGGIPRLTMASMLAGWLTLAVATGFVLTGQRGTLSVRPQHEYYMAVKHCLDHLPRPLYVNRPYLSLPWMTPGSIPFILSWNYYIDRVHGGSYERGGLPGLIAEKRLAAIVITRVMQTEIFDGLDGRPLDGYRRTELSECPNMIVFLRDQ